VAVEAVSAALVELIYERFLIRSTAFCNFISELRKNPRNPPFLADPSPKNRPVG
jgi:hypothetical protein